MANQITPFPPLRSATTAPSISATRPAPPKPSAEPYIPADRSEARKEDVGTGSSGFGAILDQGLGHAHLPDPIELVAALEAAGEHADMADRAVPGLGKLVSAVIEDEARKLLRYLDLRAL
ncbi:hypothetical protein [Paracoccus alkanivorans]|uniref:Uncharacterized protein n=1 Tax=Paracoccus alkanivorans TaxID=2116655 RepID=A0A3M0MB00_9RHOB|nr:hypothetical protein [Paracoccus alkanivorans]RMC34922.1 hypothetical protein C9E81_12600 [Paracoccus alkanivorans]